ncbi:MAG: DUF3152 domain-containing protein [Micromonosporaceae bacterium]|nr:DUF3152 domain-containing protein [Micromonosporaceae bacterium]
MRRAFRAVLRRRRVALVTVAAVAMASLAATSGVAASAYARVMALAQQPSAPAVVRGNDWYLRASLTAGAPETSFRFGLPTDHPLFGDWDGDGKATPGLFRNGTWMLRNKVWGGSVETTVEFGRPGDIPVVGDWDGDGDDGLGVFRDGLWLFDDNRDGATDRMLRFGRPTDTPVAGDWNGIADASLADLPGLRRNGGWLLVNQAVAGGGRGVSFTFGAGRWQDGASADQIGVVRGTDWLLRNSHSGGPADTTFPYGQSDDFFLTWGGAAQSLSQPVRHYTYKVGVKGSVNSSLQRFADLARETLNDQRGWSLGRHIRFSRIYTGTADMNLWLATGEEVAKADPICDEEWSCRVGKNVYVNIRRWNNGTVTWSPRPIKEYRQYIFNHEVGHWMGLPHSGCPGSGAAAPVMMQQSINLYGCKINLWPTHAERQKAYDRHIATVSGATATPPEAPASAEAE